MVRSKPAEFSQPMRSRSLSNAIHDSSRGRAYALFLVASFYRVLSYAILRHKGQAMRIEISCPYDSEPLILHVQESYRSPFTPGGC